MSKNVFRLELLSTFDETIFISCETKVTLMGSEDDRSYSVSSQLNFLNVTILVYKIKGTELSEI